MHVGRLPPRWSEAHENCCSDSGLYKNGLLLLSLLLLLLFTIIIIVTIIIIIIIIIRTYKNCNKVLIELPQAITLLIRDFTVSDIKSRI